MAQKTVVAVVCDLPHDGEVEGTETVSFAFDGTAYEIDVCATHAKDLREKFGKYVEHTRRVTGGGGGRRRRSRSGPGVGLRLSRGSCGGGLTRAAAHPGSRASGHGRIRRHRAARLRLCC